MRVVYSRLRAALQGTLWRTDALRRTGKLVGPIPQQGETDAVKAPPNPTQQQARETNNPVTGLIHQARKCLAEGVAAYIVRRPWRAAQ